MTNHEGHVPAVEGDWAESRAVVGRIARVLVPTTAVVGLLYYYGYVYSQRLYLEFGVDVDGLGFSTPEYLTRSANVVVDPIVAIAVVVVVAVLVHSGVTLLLGWQRRPAWVVPTLIAGFVGLGLLAMVLFAVPSVIGWASYIAAALWLVGALMFVYGLYLGWRIGRNHRTGKRLSSSLGASERSTLTVMLLLAALALVTRGAFELTRTYAIERGEEVARWVETHCDTYPIVRVFSTVDLQIDHDGVDHAALSQEEGAFRHRYTGLRQFNHDNGRYLMWSAATSPFDGLLVLPDDERLRVEPDLVEGVPETCPTRQG